MNEERKIRSDAGNLQITERDIQVLTWICEQYCIPFDQLRKILGGKNAKAKTIAPDVLSLSATRNAIERWLQLELIEPPRKIIAGYPPYLWLSRRGIGQLGLPYSYYQPKPSTMKHLYAVNAIRLQIEDASIGIHWHSMRTMMRLSAQRPVPDAELRTNEIIAIQVIERPELIAITLQDAFTTFSALAERYTKLWYFCSRGTLDTLKEYMNAFMPEVEKHVTFYPLDLPKTHP